MFLVLLISHPWLKKITVDIFEKYLGQIFLGQQRASEAVSYGEIFSRNICPKFLPANISPPHELGNMESVLRFRFFFLLVFITGSESVSIRGDRGKR